MTASLNVCNSGTPRLWSCRSLSGVLGVLGLGSKCLGPLATSTSCHINTAATAATHKCRVTPLPSILEDLLHTYFQAFLSCCWGVLIQEAVVGCTQALFPRAYLCVASKFFGILVWKIWLPKLCRASENSRNHNFGRLWRLHESLHRTSESFLRLWKPSLTWGRFNLCSSGSL